MKVCIGCLRMLPLEDYWLTTKGAPRPRCKPCTNAQNRGWAEAHPEAMRRHSRKWVAAHPEAVRASSARYWQENREDLSAKNKAWQEAHPNRYREWYWRDPARSRMLSRVKSASRRVLEREAQGRATPAAMQARWDYFGGKCWRCKGPAQDLDHMMPLALGGPMWPANLRPACKPCNGYRGALTRCVVQRIKKTLGDEGYREHIRQRPQRAAAWRDRHGWDIRERRQRWAVLARSADTP